MLKVNSKTIESKILFVVCPMVETIVYDYVKIPEESKLPRGVIINCCPTDNARSSEDKNTLKSTKKPSGRVVDIRRFPVPIVYKSSLVKNVIDKSVLAATVELAIICKKLLDNINDTLFVGIRNNKWKFQNDGICRVVGHRRVQLYPIFNIAIENFELLDIKLRYSLEDIMSALKYMYMRTFSGATYSYNHTHYNSVSEKTSSNISLTEHSLSFTLSDINMYTLLILDVKLRDAIYAATGYDFSASYNFDEIIKKYIIYIEVPNNELQ